MAGISIPFFSFTGHMGEILDIIVTLDSKYIIYAINDGTIRFIDYETKELVKIFQCVNSFPISISLSYDGMYLASADSKGFIEIWDLKTNNKLNKTKAYDVEIFDIAFSSKDYYLITSGESASFSLKRWKIEKNGNLKLEKDIELEDEISQVLVTPKNNSVIALGEDIIYISNFKLDKGLQQIQHEGLCAINISSDGKLLFGGDDLGRINVWEVKKGELLEQLVDKNEKSEFGKPLYNLAISPDNKYLIYGDRLKIKIWDFENKSILYTIKSPGKKDDKDKFNTVFWAPNGEYFAVGGSQRLRICNADTGKWIKAFRRPPPSPPFFDDYEKAVISPDLKHLIVTRDKITEDGAVGIVECWDIVSGKRLYELEPPIAPGANISCVAIAPNGKFFVTGDDADSSAARAIIWNLKTGKIKKRIQDLDYGVAALIISHDSEYIITSDATFDVEIWNAKTGKLKEKLSESTKNITHFSITEDQKFLVCAFRDVLDREHDIIVWNMENNQVINQLSAEIDWDDRIVWIGFSNDYKHLYARSEDGYLINWEFKSGKLLKKVEDKDNYVLYNPFTEVNVIPLSETILFLISDKSKELPVHFKEFVLRMVNKSEWISLNQFIYALRKSCTQDEINQFDTILETLSK